MLLRISPSDLEQWRMCRENVFSKTPADFIAHLETPFQTNDKIEVGKAFHSMVEKHKTMENFIETSFDEQGRHYSNVFVKGEQKVFEFRDSAIELARALSKMGGVSEVSISKIYTPIAGYKVHSEMRIDLARGLQLHEFKTKALEKPLTEYDVQQSQEKYTDSMQWRMYLDAMPEALDITYWVCYLRLDPENPSTVLGAYNPLTFTLQRYKDMQLEIEQEMANMIRFLEANNKLHLIYKKQ